MMTTTNARFPWKVINLRLIMIMMVSCLLLTIAAQGGEDQDRIRFAQAFRARGEPVTAAPDGNFYCEAEEFQVEHAGEKTWRAGYWGQNYYAATFANTFLSRKAFLGAPEQCPETRASVTVEIAEPGRYLVLVRYEAAYRFETQFRVTIEQGGNVRFDRLYGARDNVKIWAFGQKLKTEVAWPWGAVENIVWEGHDAFVELPPGRYTLSLIAGPQKEPGARRHVDLVMLTRDEEQVKRRIETERYLPLDGMLTQQGDVWMRVRNTGDTPVTVHAPPAQEHSPYWVHQRQWRVSPAKADPRQTSDWVDVGGGLDALNDGQWSVTADGPCVVEFGIRNAAGAISPRRSLTFAKAGKMDLISRADFRYSRKLQTRQEGIDELLEYLNGLPPIGRLPTETLVLATAGQLVPQLEPIFGLNGYYVKRPKGYVDWRGKGPAALERLCAGLSEDERSRIAIVSLGDEIGLPAPSAEAAHAGFAAFCKAQGLRPSQVDPNAGDDWEKVNYSPDPNNREANPTLFYWSRRYLYHYGIQAIKAETDVLRRHLPNAHIGANFSPHHGGAVNSYLGEVFKWVTCFREDGMTLPWSEDYVWQVPVGSPQMNGINLDLARAGNRGKAGRQILYYVMPHYPGNTPRMWRRLFYNALSHGMTIPNLFEFSPVWAAYTENHVTGLDMYGTILHTVRELGTFEDIVQSGRRPDGVVGLWFSETADIWGDNEKSFAAAKRALYVALQGTPHPLDFLVDQDALDGTLDRYQVLYLTDCHVASPAAERIVAWVRAGGRLFATAGAGLYDEYNRPNRTLRELMGIEPTGINAPDEDRIGFIKEDLPFAQPVDTIVWRQATEEGSEPVETRMAAYGLTVRLRTVAADVAVAGTFADGSPAIVRRSVGQGQVIACAFLPSLTFFKPAVPLKPLDRGSTDDAMAHFIPTAFDPAARALIVAPLTDDLPRPVVTDNALVETAHIVSPVGTVVFFQNWSEGPIAGLRATLNLPVEGKTATLASGRPLTRDGTTFVFDLDVAEALVVR
jgi:hypothetical protein